MFQPSLNGRNFELPIRFRYSIGISTMVYPSFAAFTVILVSYSSPSAVTSRLSKFFLRNARMPVWPSCISTQVMYVMSRENILFPILFNKGIFFAVLANRLPRTISAPVVSSLTRRGM